MAARGITHEKAQKWKQEGSAGRKGREWDNRTGDPGELGDRCGRRGEGPRSSKQPAVGAGRAVRPGRTVRDPRADQPLGHGRFLLYLPEDGVKGKYEARFHAQE